MKRSSRGMAAALMMVLFLAACSESEEVAPESSQGASSAVQVEAYEVQVEERKLRRKWMTQLEPLRREAVQAPAGGVIAFLNVEEGAYVEEGEVLARLARPGESARLRVLKERRDRLAEEVERWEGLARVEAAGPAEVEEARLRLLEVEEALAAVEGELNTFTLRAPVSGRVAAVSVSAGSAISEGQALLEVEDHRYLGGRLTVSAEEALLFSHRERLKFEDGLGEELELREVLDREGARSGFVNLELIFETPEDRRRREITVVYEEVQEMLIVPWTSVATEHPGHWVAVLAGDPPRVERREIRLGGAHSAGVEVREGLEAGEKIISYEPRTHPEGREVEALVRER